MDGLTCRMKEYIQPFERQLALQELRALAGGPVIPVGGNDATAIDLLNLAAKAMPTRYARRWRTGGSVGDDEDGLNGATLG